MAEKLKVELQDENGNIYYLHTDASVVFCEDGTTVAEKLALTLNESDIVNNATTAPTDKVVSPAVAKNLQDQLTALNTKMTFENWSSFNNAVMRCRYAGILFLVGSASDWTLVAKQYTTILTLPEGYRPQIEIPFVADSFGSGIQISGIIKPSGELQLYPTAETSYWRFSVNFPTVG